MVYKYDAYTNYEHFSPGRVFYHKSGITNFPARLATEIFNRSLEYSTKKENVSLYDPCCGGGYLLAVTAFLNYEKIGKLYGSDIHSDYVALSRKNVSLLTQEGLSLRKKQILEMIEKYDKKSHKEALSSISVFEKIIENKSYDYTMNDFFVSDVFSPARNEIKCDLIITDLPYGNIVDWKSQDDIDFFLEKLKAYQYESTIITLIHNKKTKIRNPSYLRLQQLQIGKRKITIMKKQASRPSLY